MIKNYKNSLLLFIPIRCYILFLHRTYIILSLSVCQLAWSKFSLYIFIFLIFSFVSCTRQKQPDYRINLVSKVIETNGYVVPIDSMAEPIVKVVDKSKLITIPVGNPKVILTNTNVHIAGNPEIILAGTPHIFTPGTDTFSLPKSFNFQLSVSNSVVAGIPETVIAKDANIKDRNPDNFSSFSKLQGLKHTSIICLIQDKNANLWFGTQGGGVSRYDGKYFTHFTEKEGLCNNEIWCMLEDKTGNFWFGTQGGGVSMYNGKYFIRLTEKEGLSNNDVRCMLEDKKGNLWFGTYGGGVNKYDGKCFTHFTKNEGLSNNNVISVFEDKKGNLWFGTFGGGVNKYDGKSFIHFTEKEGLGNNDVRSVIEDKNGNLWFGTFGGGINKYDGKSFTRFTEKEGLSNNNVRSVIEDKSGNLWIGTFGGGANKFDGKCFTHFTEKEGLSDNDVRCIFEDKSGTLWFGTYFGGVNKYNGNCFTHFTEKEGLSNNSVLSMLKDKYGNMWFGTYGGGVSKYDGKSFTYYTEKEGLGKNDVRAMLEDKCGNIWFCTYGAGVNKFDGKSFTHFTEKEGLSNNDVRSVDEDKEGNLWFGTAGGGVNKYDGISFTHFTKKEGLGNNVVLAVLADNKGNLWFGTGGGGVSKYDGKNFTHFTEKEGLSNNDVRSIFEDKNGYLWFGTGSGGVNRYDGKSFINFTEKEGLSNSYVFSILEDKSENFWFGTRFGMNKLTLQNFASFIQNQLNKRQFSESNVNDLVFFTNYGYEDGFLGIGCFGNSICEDNNGTIWIGANDRLTAYHPEGDYPDTIAPNIQLTNIALFNDNIAWLKLQKNKDSTLILGNGVRVSKFEFDSISKWYGLPENLSLAYNNNYLTFNFIGITQKQAKKVKYQYLLEGLDENWSALTSRNEAPYGNLPYGVFTFKVKAVNSEGYWSKEYSYTFTIRPPWWKTWWFRSIMVTIILLLIYGFIKWRERKLEKDKLLLETKVKEQTQELFDKNEELNQQNEEITTQRDEIEAQRDIVIEQKENIEKIHKEIEQSIDYAKRLQAAILPNPEILKDIISEYFVIFKPKDKVSGDFYWWAIVENNLIITVADCTGHGVPGAFMSMLGTSFLREIVVKEYMTNPAIILKRMRKEIILALKQKGESGEQKDGMDMAIVVINIETLEAQFAGANNPLWIVKSSDGKSLLPVLDEIRPDKMPVAIYENMHPYTNNEIRLQKGDIIYLASDGYEDQFGGPKGKKFLSKNMKNLLIANCRKPMAIQGEILDKTIEEWKNGFNIKCEQVDDITVMGIKIS